METLNTTHNISKKIESHLQQARELATQEVERLAREVLRLNPNETHKFIMATGTYFFIDARGNNIHSFNEKYLKGYGELEEFIRRWNDVLCLTDAFISLGEE